ncbi:MAG: lactate utilization protein [Thermoguttaceae bacterium]|nr:lactate utilization protein [Thermoguttaceae bacterium]MDW8077649.1 lactate utilization protein B [Thermoguttaceae bacterium]
MKHSPIEGAEFLAKETKWLAEPRGSKALELATKRSAKTRDQIAASIAQWESWREQAARIKAYAISRLDHLLRQFEENITARGATVLWAENSRQANEHVLGIARKHGVRLVVKSKSMVSEEMELNRCLETIGVAAVETDLGEFLVQLAGQRPTHIVTPALHLSAEDIGKMFAEKLGEPFTRQHEQLTAIARRHLRRRFLEAGMGISGANFAIADVGAVCVVENEGNAGLSMATPPVHVVLMGIEKVIPSILHLPVFLQLLARSGTGQKLTTYTHIIHGPSPGQAMYVIIVDNGRTRVLADPKLRSALSCIRCGACLNACPVYRRVGGWAYGWIYPGPIGAVITPAMVGIRKAGKLPFASSLCGACHEVCPVKIDIPHKLVYLRNLAVTRSSPVRSWLEKAVWKAWAFTMRGAWRYKLAMALARLGMRTVYLLPWKPKLLRAWLRARNLPPLPAGGPFRKRWPKLAGEAKPPLEKST